MKKRLPILALAMLLCLSLLPMRARAAVTLPAYLYLPTEPKAVEMQAGNTEIVMVSFKVPENTQEIVRACYADGMSNGEKFIIQIDWSINSDSDWKCSGRDTWKGANESFMSEYGSNVSENDAISGTVNIEMFRASYSYPKYGGYASIVTGNDDTGKGFLNLDENSITMRVRFKLESNTKTIYSQWSKEFRIGTMNPNAVPAPSATPAPTAAPVPVLTPWTNASGWAVPELERANALGLFPTCLYNTDLTQPITRAEFAAVSVKAYEALTGEKPAPAAVNPFTDTADTEVLKALGLGITSGTNTAGTLFSPDVFLKREQAATMLARVYKRVNMPDWTLASDGFYTLEYSMPNAFTDDTVIASYARDSVYFMAANGVINGSGNKFSPDGNATREAALLFAVRLAEKLGR